MLSLIVNRINFGWYNATNMKTVACMYDSNEWHDRKKGERKYAEEGVTVISPQRIKPPENLRLPISHSLSIKPSGRRTPSGFSAFRCWHQNFVLKPITNKPITRMSITGLFPAKLGRSAAQVMRKSGFLID